MATNNEIACVAGVLRGRWGGRQSENGRRGDYFLPSLFTLNQMTTITVTVNFYNPTELHRNVLLYSSHFGSSGDRRWGERKEGVSPLHVHKMPTYPCSVHDFQQLKAVFYRSYVVFHLFHLYSTIIISMLRWKEKWHVLGVRPERQLLALLPM